MRNLNEHIQEKEKRENFIGVKLEIITQEQLQKVLEDFLPVRGQNTVSYIKVVKDRGSRF